MLSNKSITNRKTILDKNEIAEILNNFFSNFTKALGIPQNVYPDLLIGDIDDPRLRVIVKYHKTF